MSTGIGIYVEPHTNNIGIGITAPTKKLHVVGDTRLEGNLTVNGTQTIINTDVITTEQIVATNAGTGPALIVTQTGDHPIAEFIDDSTTVMKIVNGGNVGMGTADPQQRLHVQGSILATTQHLGPTADTSNAPGFSWSGDADTGIYRPAANTVGVVTGGLERMRVLDNGNVGIGTTNPQQALHVQGSARVDGNSLIGDSAMADSHTVQGSASVTYNGANAALIVNQQGSGKVLELQDAGTACVTVLDGGNVGIGTTNPQQQLHIGGSGALIIPIGTTAQQPSIPLAGMIRYNTSLNKIEYFNTYGWIPVGSSTFAVGGTITASGSSTIHTFTSSSTFQVQNGGFADILIVAGGGGGGYDRAAGGGAGGLIYISQLNIVPGTYNVTVGNGGAGGTSYTDVSVNGQNSTFYGYTAIGGGRGGMGGATPGVGGSGGGAYFQQSPAYGTVNQGYAGGDDFIGSGYNAGGGGGAGAVGATATSTNGGNGGIGRSYNISGSAVYYAGGGGGSRAFDGGSSGTASGVGGLGGGGNAGNTAGAAGSPGSPNTGGGGGGGANIPQGAGGNGGSGIVIIRY